LRWCRIGKIKAAVFPEPVGAQHSTSLFYTERDWFSNNDNIGINGDPMYSK